MLDPRLLSHRTPPRAQELLVWSPPLEEVSGKMWRAVAVIARISPTTSDMSLGPWRDTLMTTPTPHTGPHERLTDPRADPSCPYRPTKIPAPVRPIRTVFMAEGRRCARTGERKQTADAARLCAASRHHAGARERAAVRPSSRRFTRERLVHGWSFCVRGLCGGTPRPRRCAVPVLASP